MLYDKSRTSHGFTIVELLVAIAVIAILAAITVIGYLGVSGKARVAGMSSDLSSVSTIFEMYKAENGVYPTDISTTTMKASSGVVLQSATAPDGGFCVNAYSLSDASLFMSYASSGGLQKGLCDGATIGAAIGGTVPTAPRNVNLSPGFERWTLSGTASYNSATKELTLGLNGEADSPLIRIDKPVGILTGADFYATTASPNASITPNSGYHIYIQYFASDGVTKATSSGGYQGNGCAPGFAPSNWKLADISCGYYGGSQLVYARFSFLSFASGYASSDLKVRNPIIEVTD